MPVGPEECECEAPIRIAAKQPSPLPRKPSTICSRWNLASFSLESRNRCLVGLQASRRPVSVKMPRLYTPPRRVENQDDFSGGVAAGRGHRPDPVGAADTTARPVSADAPCPRALAQGGQRCRPPTRSQGRRCSHPTILCARIASKTGNSPPQFGSLERVPLTYAGVRLRRGSADMSLFSTFTASGGRSSFRPWVSTTSGRTSAPRN